MVYENIECGIHYVPNHRNWYIFQRIIFLWIS